jgi:Zn-dependent peptidase ImmA (M78 family)
MPKSFEVQVVPSVLTWARTTAGWNVEDIGKKLRKDRQLIESWESGTKNPTLHQLISLADYYKRPLAALLLPEPPKEPQLPHDFRNLQDGNSLNITPKTRFAMRRAMRLQSIAKELSEEPFTFISQRIGSAKVSDNPEVLAEKTRVRLGIDIQTQMSWKDTKEALNQWVYSIEASGILVFQMSMPIEDARAFSLFDNELPVIVISTKEDSLNAKIFSLFHELGHILLSGEGICDPGSHSESVKREGSEEAFCNRFAGALLVPMDQLMNHNLVRNAEKSGEWDNSTLQKLSKNFKVSQEVVLRRLLLAGLTTDEFYKTKREEWRVKDQRIQEKRPPGGGRNIPRECIQQNGVPLVSLILDSYKSKKITKSDVADYLGISLKYLSDVERSLEA